MKELHIAVAQVHARAMAVADNLARVAVQVEAAARAGCQAVLFAEAVLHAYVFTAANLAYAEPALQGPATRGVVALAVRHRLVVAAGFLERSQAGWHNSVLVAFPDGSAEVRRKTELTPAERSAGLVPGCGRFEPVGIGGIPCAVVICSDAGHPGLSAKLRANDIRFRLCPTAGGDIIDGIKEAAMSPDDLASPAGRERYARLRSKVFEPSPIRPLDGDRVGGFASANALGYDGVATDHMGHCMIADERGVVLAQIPGTPVAAWKLDHMTHAKVGIS